MLSPVPVPSSSPLRRPASRVVILPDDQSVIRLIEEIVDRAGLSRTEVAARLGVAPQTFNQYTYLKKRRPSVQWLARLLSVCGGKLVVEFPSTPL